MRGLPVSQTGFLALRQGTPSHGPLIYEWISGLLLWLECNSFFSVLQPLRISFLPGIQPAHQILGRNRTGEIVALSDIALEALQQVPGRLIFYSLCHYLEAQVMGHAHR